MASNDICVLLNVGSGKPDAQSQPESIRAAFAAHKLDVTIREITKGSRLPAAVRKAMDDGFRTIVAAGGDGTISGVAAILAGSRTQMGILPLGTFNYFARSLDLPIEVQACVGVIVEGHTVPLRAGMVNETMFLNNASLGAYPAILESREDIYRRWGRSRLAAYWAVLKALTNPRRPLHLRLTIDGASRTIRTPLVFLVNNAYQLKQLKLEGAERVEAGEMALFIAPVTTRLGMIGHAIAVAMGRAQAERNFELSGGKDIKLENIDRPAYGKRTVAMDGERKRLSGPFRFHVVENALQVIVPADRKPEVR